MGELRPSHQADAPQEVMPLVIKFLSTGCGHHCVGEKLENIKNTHLFHKISRDDPPDRSLSAQVAHIRTHRVNGHGDSRSLTSALGC